MAGRTARHIVARRIWGGWKETDGGCRRLSCACQALHDAGGQEPLVPGRERDGRSPEGPVAGSRCWRLGEGAEDAVSLVI